MHGAFWWGVKYARYFLGVRGRTNRELWFLGVVHCEVYYNTGALGISVSMCPPGTCHAVLSYVTRQGIKPCKTRWI